MQAVILAGGWGTRLRPFTVGSPGCLIPVQNRPFLYYLLKMLRMRKIDNVVLCIGYLGNQIQNYCGDGKKIGIPINYSRERDGLLGTGGSLKLAAGLLEETFFVIYGNTYMNLDYREVFDKFSESARQALVVAYRCHFGERSDLEIDVHSVVTKYQEDSRLRLGCGAAGVFVFKKDILTEIETGRPISLENEVFPKIVKQHHMIAFVTTKRVFKVNTFGGQGVFMREIRKKEKE
jgi:NDP-sugar pyrophosphorylase family protein